MATSLKHHSENNTSNSDIYTLHDMFRIVGDQLTQRDIRTLTSVYKNLLCDDLLAKVKDGYSFLLALEKLGRVDDSNFKDILEMLKCITRHDLAHLVTLTRRKPVVPDPVDEYLENTAKSNTIVAFKRKNHHLDSLSPSTSSASTSSSSSTSTTEPHTDPPPTPSTSGIQFRAESPQESFVPPTKRRRLVGRGKGGRGKGKDEDSNVGRKPEMDEQEAEKAEIKKKVTCGIRLRVRAEYCHHESALEGNVHSNKPELIEQQFERFMQANTILKSRDLGSIICDIKFSELTYLDAFWRDYINGALLEALKGVFITESLKQAVGHEAIKLLVNVDEDDYEAGRLTLLTNLTD